MSKKTKLLVVDDEKMNNLLKTATGESPLCILRLSDVFEEAADFIRGNQTDLE